MVHYTLSLSLRRNMANLLTLITCLGCTFYYIYGAHCGMDEIQLKSIKSSSTFKLIPQENGVNLNKIFVKKFSPKIKKIKSNKKKKLKYHKHYQNINKFDEITKIKNDLELATFQATNDRETTTKSSTTIKTRTTSTTSTTVSPKSKPVIKDVWTNEWPRVNINNCAHMEFMNRGINSHEHFKSWPYPRTGIVSFPGSGNTWTRHLIQQATGLWTGSVYTDRSLYKGGFLAELDACDDNSTVAIKAHYPRLDSSSYCKFDRAILVVRDPYRAVLAEFNWRSTSQHTGVADPRLFKTKLWKSHVVDRTEKWLATTKGWIERFMDKNAALNLHDNPYTAPANTHKRFLLLSYERMKRNETKEMSRVIEFLGLPVYRRHCVEEEADGNFHRKSKKSESIECLFVKYNLHKEVQKRVDNLVQFSQEMGLGDISAEFEGPSGEVIPDKCNYV